MDTMFHAMMSRVALGALLAISVPSLAAQDTGADARIAVDVIRSAGAKQDSTRVTHVISLAALRAHQEPPLALNGWRLPASMLFFPDISADVLCADIRPYNRMVSSGGQSATVSGIGDAPEAELVVRGDNGLLSTTTTEWRRARDGWYAESTVQQMEAPVKLRVRYTLTLPDDPALKAVRRVPCPAPEPDGAEAPNGGRTRAAGARVPRDGS